MAYYQYRRTARGEYRVTNWADQECGSYSTEEAAQALVDELEANIARRKAQHQQALADAQAYQNATPTLTEAQLTWQEWRTWFYGAMRWAAKDTAAMQRALDMKAEQYAGLPSFEKQEGYLAEAMREDVEAARLYSQAQDLDTRIKAARRNRDTAALAEALARGPHYDRGDAALFPDGRPAAPEPPKRGGTAPNASLILTADELAFIEERFGGSKSAAIHAALAAMKRSE